MSFTLDRSMFHQNTSRNDNLPFFVMIVGTLHHWVSPWDQTLLLAVQGIRWLSLTPQFLLTIEVGIRERVPEFGLCCRLSVGSKAFCNSVIITYHRSLYLWVSPWDQTLLSAARGIPRLSVTLLLLPTIEVRIFEWVPGIRLCCRLSEGSQGFL